MIEKSRDFINGLEWIADRCLTTNELFIGFMVIDIAFLYMFYLSIKT